MGHQVNFFMLPADLPGVEAAVRATADVCILQDRTPAPEPAEVATLAVEPGDVGRRPLTAYIVRRRELGAVTTRFIAEQGHWVIDSSDSPVIEFTRCFFDGTVLRRGRAYFPADLRFCPELPSPDFVLWADEVLARIKKQLSGAPGIAPYIYASAGALRWIGQDDVSGNDRAFRKTGADR